jgi:alpha-glucosidase
MNIAISGQGQSTDTLSACAEPRVSQGGIRGFQRRALLLLLLATSLPLTALGAGWQHIGEVRRVERLPDGIELVAGPARVRITAFHDGVIRVRLAASGTFATEPSWAVVEQPAAPSVKIEETRDEVRMTAGRIVVRVTRSPLLITFLDSNGNVLLTDDSSLPMAWDGARVRVWKKMPAEEFYYGLGDKAGPLNRRNRVFTLWNTDAYAWQESTDPLYKAIPFFLGLRHGTAYGVFLDNTYRTGFDFGEDSATRYSFGADGGELNYYFFAGPKPKTVIEEFTALIGRTPLPPLWALGYQQSRWSYDSEARVREIARLFRAKKIPADALYLDIDYQDGNRPFTVDRKRFPHFEQMIRDLLVAGFHTVAITDLHIKKESGYAPYEAEMAADAFVKNADGSVYAGEVWPGECVFPDFTLSRVRAWWGLLYKDFVNMGISGFWNDMNEPAIFKRADKTMPLEVVHRLDDGGTLGHAAVHNIYGMENARATYEGLHKLRPNERPFVLTRAAFAGAQRYAASWTGDNSSTWNHLRMTIPTLLSLGLSGYPLVGADVGGFVGSPPPDLLTRWIELGALQPLFRNHTTKESADQEPWVHGPEHEAIRRRSIELRYRLLPYIYTSVEEMSRTGTPLMRPVFLEYPQAEEFYGEDREFLFGPDLLIAPVVEETLDAYKVRFPPGEWYDYWTGDMLAPGKTIEVKPQLDVIPLYVRAGAILSQQPLVQSTNETPGGLLELRVYPGQECRGTLYLDDGRTFAYTKGEYLRVNYTCQSGERSVRVTSSARQGNFMPWWSSVQVTVFGADRPPRETRAGQRVLSDWHYDAKTKAVTLTMPDSPAGWELRLKY